VQVRITDPKLTGQLDAMFASALDPATRCWVLDPNGNWEASPSDGSSVRDHQAQMLLRHRAVG
jgi:polyphosphate kinase